MKLISKLSILLFASILLSMCGLSEEKSLQKIEVSVVPNSDKESSDKYEFVIRNRNSTPVLVKAKIELQKVDANGEKTKKIVSVSQRIYPNGGDSVSFGDKNEEFEFKRILNVSMEY